MSHLACPDCHVIPAPMGRGAYYYPDPRVKLPDPAVSFGCGGIWKSDTDHTRLIEPIVKCRKGDRHDS